MSSPLRTRLAASLKHAWASYKALLHTDVCEICGEPCEPQSSVVTACVPSCETAAIPALEMKVVQPAFESAFPGKLKLVA